VRVLDLFCGAGGLSLGVEEAGFEIAAGAEWDPDACETFAKAHPTADVWPGDVNAMDFRRLRGEIEVVVGGPPCQPWSSGGKRLGTADPRDGWPAFLRALAQVRPIAFVAENVAGLAAGARCSAFRALLAELEALGFTVAHGVLDAADHGVPQRRRRLFVVGARSGPVPLPAATYGGAAGRPWRTAGEVVDDEPCGPPNRSVVTYARAPDVRPNPYDGHVYNGGGRPIDRSRPAPTLLASMGGNKTPWVDTLGVVVPYHAHLLAGGEPRAGIVAGARRITIDEAARLQSFPDAMPFAGRSSSCYRQIGNAVPPRLAAAVGAELARAVGG
jgi:DNA (cytosine-5)-methyltransferase 1